MPINSDKPHLWKADVAQSIDFYNDWFLRFAPGTYRKQRVIRTKEVLDTFEKTYNLSQITPACSEGKPRNPAHSPHGHCAASGKGPPYRACSPQQGNDRRDGRKRRQTAETAGSHGQGRTLMRACSAFARS